METENRIKVYNVIILDKSGSMSSIAKQAIDGVNETIASIKRNQEKHPERDNRITLVAFCGCEIKKIYEQVPVGEVRPITSADYRPCCMTPLYDAIGNTITSVHHMMEGDSNAIASVTIITDGYENDSKEFSHTAIKSLIEAYKSEGWLFAYIGADHDVEAVAFRLSIDNHLAFDKTQEGTHTMFSRLQENWSDYVDEVAPIMASEELDADKKKEVLRKRSRNFFNK